MNPYNLQNIFNESTKNGNLVGLANILLEECNAEETCPCAGFDSRIKVKADEGYTEFYKNSETKEYQTLDDAWDFLWYGREEDASDIQGEYRKYHLDELVFSDPYGTNSQGWEDDTPLKNVVEQALAKTDWEKSQLWELCSLYNLIKKTPGGVTSATNQIAKCEGCSMKIEDWADKLCDLACKLFYEGMVDDETESGLKDKDGNYQFIDFDGRYVTLIPIQFEKAVLAKLGLSSYKGEKLSNCLEYVNVSWVDFDEVDGFGRSKAEGVGWDKRFKLKFLPDCFHMGNPYRDRNLGLIELDHPVSARYRGETSKQTTTNESWNCDGEGQCYDPQNGQGTYTSLAACQSNCPTTQSSETTPKEKSGDSKYDWW